MVKEITDSNFEQEVVAASKEKPVLVDFWAPWCGPCRMQGPILEEVAEEISEEAIIAKLNVDENPKKSQEFGIQSIPALKIFKDGEVVQDFVGVQTKESLVQSLRDKK